MYIMHIRSSDYYAVTVITYTFKVMSLLVCTI